MWSFSFAGSMPSSTAAIGRAVGEAVGDAAGWLAVAATAGDGAGGAAVVRPHDAKTIASTTRRRPTTPVYRARRERSLVHSSAATASGRGLATAVRRGLLGFLLRVLLAPEDGLAVLRIDEDRVALLELSGEHLLGERVDDEPLDRALDRARAIYGVEALLRNKRLRVVRKLERDLSLEQPLREDPRLFFDDFHELLRHEVLE